ncbi:MAG: adenylate/guanylate cyclase domain-containing protein [Spirochaetaceae bacterium]
MNKSNMKKIIDELLLYSGQFGLFYIIMQIIKSKSIFINDIGHLGLLLSLILQVFLLAYFGHKVKYRLLFSFIVPVIYSLLEVREGIDYLLNTAHIGFWIYAVISASLMSIKIHSNTIFNKSIEVIFVVLNVFIFLFIYFYFDTWKEVITPEKLIITEIFKYLDTFLQDPTHWFIIFGGTLLAFTIALGRYEIEKLKERITSLFGQYVDKNIRDTIINKGEYIAKKDKLCIMFADIKDFTKLCEENDAESISKMLNIYFDYWNSIVKRHNGTIDKYIGDAIMVIFGLQSVKDPCNSAAECSLEIIKNKMILEDELNRKSLPLPTDFGIGCHFGELIIGDLGSSDRKNFTVIGDTVNIASRLESITRNVHSDLILSNTMYTHLKDSLKSKFYNLGEFELKGKSSLVKVWGNKV